MFCSALAMASGCERAGPDGRAGVSSLSRSARVQGSASAPAAALSTPRVPEYRAPLGERSRNDQPAKRYANLSAKACTAELKSRNLPATPARGKTPGLAQPLRVTGPLSGVHVELPSSLHGLLDCRLILLLDDLAKALRQRGVTAIIVNNTYRPASTLPSKTAEPPPSNGRKGTQSTTGAKTSKAAKAKAAKAPARLSQHALGLAIDITAFELEGGTVLNVERDWHGALGSVPCGPASTVFNDNPAGVTLRNLTCGIASSGYCNHLITPCRDPAHANHLHCDIEAGASEMMVE